MKTSRIFVIALLVLFAFANMASSATALNVGASFPMLGKILAQSSKNEVHAGLTLLATTSETATGGQKAVFQGGYLNIPSNEQSKKANWVKNTDIANVGLFPEFNFLKIDPLILGIEEKNIVEEKVVSEAEGVQFDPVSKKIVIDVSTLSLGQHYLKYELTHRQSRTEDRFLIFRWVKHPKVTDLQVIIFTVLDPSVYIDRFCTGYSSQKLDGKTLLRMARAYYLPTEVGSMRLVVSELSAELEGAIAAMNVGNIGNNDSNLSSAATTTTARIKFLDRSGNPITNAIQASIRNSQGELKADAVGSVATFENVSSGEYQMSFFVYINEEWVKSPSEYKIKVTPNMTDVTVTVGRRGGSN